MRIANVNEIPTYPALALSEEYRELENRKQAIFDRQLHRLEEQMEDAFMSQWAGDRSIAKLNLEQQLVLQNGLHAFTTLYTLDGEEIEDARVIEDKWGKLKWVFERDGETIFLPHRPKRASTLVKRGYEEAWALKPAKVEMRGNGWNVSPVIVRA